MKSFKRFGFLMAAVVLMSGIALAQDQDAPSDPPSRVMRLQYMNGQVSMQPGGVDDWVPANLNRPLTTADRIWVDVDGRAELTMGSAALRLGSETSATLTNLDDQTAQIELDQGTLELSVRFLNQGEIVEVDTPNFAYTVERAGLYRFDVYPDRDQTSIAVRHGDGEATGQGNSVHVRSGQQFLFTQGQSLAYEEGRLQGPDGFDDWCALRERRETSSPSARYVAAGTIGYEDLDDNGSWAVAPEYGSVWYPRVDPGWAPYRDGHWAWVEPWGWTWVDDAPWGFAPFHYGRWAVVGGRWGWIPGPREVRPVYAPALVAWVGGPSFGVSVGIGGGVGWFPLGWRDPFIPSYHVSPVYARNVNISNSRVVNTTIINNYYTTNNVTVRNTTINNIQYENAKVNGAVTGVSSATFASGKPIRGNTVVIPPNAIGRANVMAGAQVVPTKEAVLGGHAPAAAPQHLVAPRQVVAKAPPPPRPVSFDQQKPMLEKSGGVPLRPAERAQIRASNPTPAPTGGRAPVAAPGGKAPGAAVNNQPAGRAPMPIQPTPPKGNESFGRAPAEQPATSVPKPPPAKAYQPPANNNEPARNIARPPVEAAPPQRNAPPLQGQRPPAQEERVAPAKPATVPAPPSKPAPEVRAVPAPQRPAPEVRPAPPPRPAPEVHAAPPPSRPAPEVRPAPPPPARTVAPPPPAKKTPPEDEKDKKNKEKDKER